MTVTYEEADDRFRAAAEKLNEQTALLRAKDASWPVSQTEIHRLDMTAALMESCFTVLTGEIRTNGT